MPAKIKRFVNLLLRTATLVSKFALVFVLAKFLEPVEVDLNGLLVATPSPLWWWGLGFDFYTYSTRELIASFAGLDAFEDLKSDESAILRFRNLVEKYDLTVAIFAEVNAVLSEKGLSRRRRTVVDATLIAPH